MRTKALFLAAVLGVAGLATSFAQVYSVNAVGYINLTLGPGWQMVANQLDDKAGNYVTNVLKGLADQSTLYKYNGTTFETMTYYVDPAGDIWVGANDGLTLSPGEGAWINVPAAGATKTVTLVGEVPQGNLSSSIPKGFSIMSSIVPKDLDMRTEAEWPAEDGDTIYKWNRTKNAGKGDYDVVTSYLDPGPPATVLWVSGDGSTPTAAVGESFWIMKSSAKTWTRTFSVNN